MRIVFQLYILLTYFWRCCRISIMRTTHETDTIRFTVKGQVVIPRWLRNRFEIAEGTRAQVYADGDHIILKPITPKYLRTLRGSLKGTGVLKALMDDRKREREL